MSSLQVQEFEQRVIKNDTAITFLLEGMAIERFDYPSKTPKNKLEVTLVKVIINRNHELAKSEFNDQFNHREIILQTRLIKVKVK